MSKSARFETCFAQGLDLSEFATTTTTTSSSSSPAPTAPTRRTTSHAAELLAVTQKKAHERQVNESQEMALALAMQERSRVVSEKSTTTRPKKEAHAALVQMHALDKAHEPRQRLITKGPKTLKKKKNNPSKHTKQTASKRRGR